MPLPRGDEYQIAVQTPRRSFSDPELQSCQVETTVLGLPKPYAGGFTTTYHFYTQSQTNTTHWAVRCFTRQVADLHQRYRAIGRFTRKSQTGYFVTADCILQGIRVNNTWLPVIKMEWVEGDPLNVYVERNLGSPEQVSKLAERFLTMVQTLVSMGVAHGDLQHGNILVKNDELFLIDYDGIYLPDLRRLSSNEIGHPNYQHPERGDRDFDTGIDRFSAIVIYLGLLATAANPGLWKQYEDGENILFRKEDFHNPGHSPLLTAINAIPSLSEMTRRFMGVCKLGYDKTPDLEQFIQGTFSYPKVTFADKLMERPTLRFGTPRPNPSPINAGNTGGNALYSGAPYSGGAVSARSYPGPTATGRLSRKEKEAFDRLYGRNPGSPGNRRQARPSSQTRRSTPQTVARQWQVNISRQTHSTMNRITASPVYAWSMAVALFIGRIFSSIGRGFAYLFLHNRPRQFTRESFGRISLFLFYAACTVVLLILIAWLANFFQ